ncbi:MAG: response regulator, partial [Magnetococcales bacterium]|nr:response regulator [Magnetococcales bacterium]
MSVKILVVDNDDLIQSLVPVVVSGSDHTTIVATSLQMAMGVLREHSFDLVITVLYLPDGSGLQLLDEIQKKYGRTNIIVITSFPDIEMVRKALREGAFDYLIKPMMPSECTDVSDRIIERQRLQEDREVLDNRLEAIFRGVDDAIVVLEEGWRIVQVNSAATRLLGLGPSSINQLLKAETTWLFPTVEPLLQQ